MSQADNLVVQRGGRLASEYELGHVFRMALAHTARWRAQLARGRSGGTGGGRGSGCGGLPSHAWSQGALEPPAVLTLTALV